MSKGGKKGGGDNDIPKINPQQLLQQMAQYNRVNVATPFGSQTYNGNQLTTQLTPEMQGLLNEQLARAGGPAPQFQLPGQNADILNGLSTRLNQRYGIPMPQAPAGGSGSTPGTGGGGAPVPAPTPSAPPSSPSPVASGGGGGGGNGFCVVASSLLPRGVVAESAAVGDYFPCHLPGTGFHDWHLEARGEPVLQPCVQLTLSSGATWRGSRTTPFNFTDAGCDLEAGRWAYAPDMLGQSVYVRTPDGPQAREVVRVDDIGEQWVVPLSFGGRSFAAGDTPEELVYSHNIMKGPDYFNFAPGSTDVNPEAWSNSPLAMNGGIVPGGRAPSGGSTGGGPVTTGALTDIQLPRPNAALPMLPPAHLSAPPSSASWLDSKWAKLGAALLGPGAMLGLGAVNKYRHRNDD